MERKVRKADKHGCSPLLKVFIQLSLSLVVDVHHRRIDADDQYTLFGVVIFRRVHEEFVQKCRENKFLVRDFVYSEEEAAKQREEMESTNATERELWVWYYPLVSTSIR